ncbi:hypothetical protein [Limosilactobacillus mucosae]|uniref:Uncharacterized protein n=1 Tax=Limosilactobacillus mucosae TaxID=97478 RepID=A0AAJ1HQ14_LIMMU|nr:hypothetical protein [Limosilactobacillus mucosae]MDC2828502.1 hypothetical protein [Limosilactobacillus mucosae]MDC2834514.1 hypothetical protein [Limosilactobacillus mucosae]
MEKIGFLLFTIALAALIAWKLILPDYRKKKYLRTILWSVLAIGFVIAGLQGPGSSENNTAKSTSSSQSSLKNKSSDKSATRKSSSTASSSSSSKKKTDSINDKLMESLTEDQGFANGTLDENGNPTQNGTKNPQYNWATHVQKILWTKDKTIAIYMYDAENLNKSQLTTVAQSAQQAAEATLMTEEKISAEQTVKGVHTTVYSGNTIIGHTKAFDNKSFVWNVK